MNDFRLEFIVFISSSFLFLTINKLNLGSKSTSFFLKNKYKVKECKRTYKMFISVSYHN